MGFSQALSGANAASKQIDVVGNNIANSQTTGFKNSSVQFADVYANSKVGLGTKVSGVLQDFSNGSIETTGRNLDLAIAGDGFLRFQQSSGEVAYSRNGQLTMDADGYLVNAQGAKVMGFGRADQNDSFSSVVPGGDPVALSVPADDMEAQATGTQTGVQATYNLDAGVNATDATQKSSIELKTDPTDANATAELNYNYSNSFTVYDSLGESHNASVYYEKTGPNAWAGKVALDGYYDDTGNNDFTLSFNSDGQLTKDATTGQITGVSGSDAKAINFSSATLGGDAADLSFDFNLAGTTQFADNSTAKTLTQDGYSSGSLVGISIQDDGTIMRNFSNEQSAAAGQIGLANFRNPEGLKPIGDNLWASTQNSGNELVGVAGTGQLGSIESNALEASNVDLTAELVDLIVAQRNFQANTNSIRTQSDILDSVIQLR